MDENTDKRKVRVAQNYKLAFALCMLAHTFYLVAFYLLDVMPLAAFNVLSVLLYLTGTIAIGEKSRLGVWRFLLFLELLAHCVLCNYFIGWGYGFCFFPVLAIPILFFYAYLDKKTKNSLTSFVFMALADIVVILTSSILSSFDNLGSRNIPYVLHGFFVLNLAVCLFIGICCSMLFYQNVRNNERELKERGEQLYYLANYDKLTGLRNRNHIMDVFKELENTGEKYSITIGDIDDFKKINDTYGHVCGDLVLTEVARTLREVINGRGVIRRWGGEEFLVALPDDMKQTGELIERVRGAMEALTIAYGDAVLKLTMTFGVAEITETGGTDQMILLADRRLYEGKRSGKNRVVTAGSA